MSNIFKKIGSKNIPQYLRERFLKNIKNESTKVLDKEQIYVDEILPEYIIRKIDNKTS